MSHVERRGLSFLLRAVKMIRAMSSQRSSAPLEYAPHLPEQRRHAVLRWWTRRILWCALTAVVVAIGWRSAKQAWYLHRQNQLMSHSALLAPLAEVAAKNANRNGWPGAAIDLLGKGGNPPVFIHELTLPDGTSRLIVVEEARWGTSLCALETTTYRPASMVPGSALKPTQVHSLLHPPMRILEAQPDKSDASHFTVTYELGGERGTLDGWLTDPDSAKLEPRDGPLKNPGLLPPADTQDKRTPSSMPA